MKKKLFVLFITAFCIFLILTISVNISKKKLYDDQAAKRWSEELRYEQISIFYPVSKGQTEDMEYVDLSHRIQTQLISQSLTDDYGIIEGKDIRFPYSIGAMGEITVTSDIDTLDLETIGVSGDFFNIHQIPLVYGSYITDDDMMDDGIVIDEESAWRLFGSSDVVGKSVEIAGVPHYVKGVVSKSKGRFSSSSGLENNMCFVNLNTLNSLGRAYGGCAYEVILPNPVDGYAMKTVNAVMGDGLNDLYYVENTYRYSISSLWKVLKDFGVRSMSTKGIIFPYYENISRAYEDVFAICLLFQVITGSIVMLTIIASLIIYFKSDRHKERKKRREKIWKDLKEFLALRSPV